MSIVAKFQTSELPFTVGENDNDLLHISPGASAADNSLFMCLLIFIASASFLHPLLWFLCLSCCLMALHTWLSLSLRLYSLCFFKKKLFADLLGSSNPRYCHLITYPLIALDFQRKMQSRLVSHRIIWPFKEKKIQNEITV